MTLLAGALALLIGLSLGLLGGGGSILTVPVLVYVLGHGAKDAITVSLAVVGLTSLAGAAVYWRHGLVNVRVALSFGLVAMLGTALGARLAQHLSGGVQLLLFATVMLVAAASMTVRESDAPRAVATGGRDGARAAMTAAQGLGVGLLTGLVGVGGGFLIVPALVLLGGMPMSEAVGTSLLIIAMNSAVGLRGYIGEAHIAWVFTAVFASAMVPGMISGAYLGRRLPQAVLRRAFALLLICVGGWMFYANIGVVLGP